MFHLSDLLVILAEAESDTPIKQDEFLNKLIPNWTSFVMQISALIVMLVIVIIIGYKPVKKMLKKRQDYVEQTILEAETSRLQAERDAKQASEMVIASKVEATRIINDAENSAILRQNEIIEAANQEVSKMKIDAEKDIERSKEEAIEEIHDQIVQVALSASSEVLKREINEKDNNRIIEDFIKEMK